MEGENIAVADTSTEVDSSRAVSETNGPQAEADAGQVSVWDIDDDVVDTDGGSEVVEVNAKPDTVDEAKVWTDDDYRLQNEDEGATFDKPMLVKLKGKVVEVSNINEMRNLVERGLGASKKYMDMAEDRKTIQFMTDNNISMDTLTQIVNGRGEEVVESESDVDRVAYEIQNSDYVDDFRSIASMLPSDVQDMVSSDAGALAGLRNDIVNGKLTVDSMDKIDRLVAINGMDFKSAYQKVTNEPIDNSRDERAEQSRNTLQNQPKNTQTKTAPAQPKSVWDMDDAESARFFEKNILKR